MKLRLFLALIGALCCASTQAGEVTVAVAANFAGPMARIAEGFTAATGHTLKVSTGATGKFYTQIISGAPFEVLLAADDESMIANLARIASDDDLRERIATNRTAADETLATLERLVRKPEAKALLADVQEARRRYVASFKQVDAEVAADAHKGERPLVVVAAQR